LLAELGHSHWIVLALAGIMAFGPRQIAEALARWRERWLGAVRDMRRRRAEIDSAEADVWTTVAGLIVALGIVLWVERL
jgi:Sec-independent protein translocase protein TatA